MLLRTHGVNPNAPQQSHSEWKGLSHGLEEVVVGVGVHIHKVERPLLNTPL